MSDKLRLRQLRAYQAIMMAGSVSGAADRLNMTQPAVSRQLAGLEAALGFRLFNRRSGGPLQPTRAGIQFYKELEGTLARLDDLPMIAGEIARRSREWVRIAATPPLINSRLLADALRLFSEDNENVRFVLEARHRLDIEEWVVSRQVDLGLSLLPVENPMITAVPLVTLNAVAVVHEDHRLAGREVVSPADLEGERLILPSRQPLRTFIDPALESSDVDLNIFIETAALTCCKYAAEGFGVAICDPFSPTAFSGAKFKILKWTPEVLLTYGVIFTSENKNSETVTSLVGYLKTALSP